jgi:hypothetical protein
LPVLGRIIPQGRHVHFASQRKMHQMLNAQAFNNCRAELDKSSSDAPLDADAPHFSAGFAAPYDK